MQSSNEFHFFMENRKFRLPVFFALKFIDIIQNNFQLKRLLSSNALVAIKWYLNDFFIVETKA